MHGRFWGFDSFTGVPEERVGAARSNHSAREWQRGAFSVAEVLGDWSFRSVEAKLKRHIGDPRVECVPAPHAVHCPHRAPSLEGALPSLCTVCVSQVCARLLQRDSHEHARGGARHAPGAVRGGRLRPVR